MTPQTCNFSIIFIICVLFGSLESKKVSLDKNITTILDEQQRQNAEIQNILFGENPKIQDCLVLRHNSTKKRKIPSTRITGPTHTHKPLWTVVVLKEEIIRNNKTLNIQQCTGSLIHSQIVLTAAHCLYNKPITKLKVRAGATNLGPHKNSTSHQERYVENIVLQKHYDPIKPKQDIALIFLKEPFNITDEVRTVCLPPTRFQVNATNVRCFVTGWHKEDHIKFGHAHFKKINLPILPNDRCERVLKLTGLGENFKLHQSFMCAGGELDKDALEGNGGAPLVCPVCGGSSMSMMQVGIMSWGFKMAPLPEVFTSVANARHWIMKQLQEKKFTLPNCGIN